MKRDVQTAENIGGIKNYPCIQGKSSFVNVKYIEINASNSDKIISMF